MRFHENVVMRALVSPLFFFGLSAFWVLAVFFLVNVMMSRKAVDVKAYMKVYNVVQILVCGYMVWGLSPCLGIPNLFGINTALDQNGEWFVFVHYLSKYLDWCDTLWIILSKKRSQLSFLHVYHHGTIVAVWGILLHSGVGGGSCRYGAWINSLTHVIMYSHYFWTSMGLRNPFKKYITMWQIGQFYSCLMHAVLVMLLDVTPVQRFAWLQLLYQLTMVYLFSSMMSWVPPSVPDFTASQDETPIDCWSFCHQDEGRPEEGAEEVAWTDRYIVIRGQAYDITSFQHPGGAHMLDLGVGRDATVMYESAHLRAELADKALARLPQCSIAELEKRGYSFGRMETWPTPGQSRLYQTLRKRVVEEVLRPRGMATGAASARGVPAWHYATVILSWLLAACWFLVRPSAASGTVLGLTLCWIGTGVQHTANHGGLTRSTTLGYALGLLNDVATGGSSIVWRYHHQVSHHAYCNDVVLDQDVHSSFPVVRLESSQPWQTYHRFQFLYAPVLFCFLWITMQIQDLTCLLTSQAFLVRFKGTLSTEITFGVLLKVIHFWWTVVIPYQVHGAHAMLVPWMCLFGVGGFALAMMFIVSHNTDHTKRLQAPDTKGDWARQQIETSTSWGGRIGSFFTGGLNLQIEHHLFPCMAHHLYADVQAIVKEECAKQSIHYSGYPTLLPNAIDHIKFLHEMGRPPKKVD